MSRIVRHSYGIKGHVSDENYRQLQREGNQARKDQRSIDESNERIAVLEQQIKRDEFFQRRAVMEVNERNFFNNTSSSLKDAKESLFKAIICEAFIEALPIDSYYVQEKVDTFSAVLCEYIDDNGGYAMLESAIKAHPETTVLRYIKNICDEIALESSTRALREQKDQPDLAKINLFELNDGEREKFEAKKSELSLESISKVIKEKVVSVVAAEKERQEKEQELKSDLAQASEEGGVMESFVAPGEPLVKSSTLYNSLFFNNYKTAISSLAAVNEHYVADDDDEEDEDMTEHLLLSTNDLTNQRDVDLDLIMCETVLQYTVLETMNTLCLKDFKRDDIVKLSEKMMN